MSSSTPAAPDSAGAAGVRVPACAPPAVARSRPALTPLAPPVPRPPGWWKTWRIVVTQLAALATITITAAAVLDARSAEAAADLAADRGAGARIALASHLTVHAAPVAVSVPALHLHSSLIDLHRLPNGALEVPKDPQQAGWYVGSSHPGDSGPTVLAGHVDSYSGPGAFYHLDRLRPGDRITVRRADKSLVAFAVTKVMKVSKKSFPTALVYVGDKRPSLRLITCGGTFNKRTGHYLDNIVVLASPVSTAKAPLPDRLPVANRPLPTLHHHVVPKAKPKHHVATKKRAVDLPPHHRKPY